MVFTDHTHTHLFIFRVCNQGQGYKSKEVGKDQESIQYITTPDLILRMFLLPFYRLTQWTIISHSFDLLLRFILTQHWRKCFSVRSVQFKSQHFELVARCLNQRKNKKMFENNRKWSFYYTPSRSVSLLTSVLIFQTAITGGWRSRMSRYFCLLRNGLRSILWH